MDKDLFARIAVVVLGLISLVGVMAVVAAVATLANGWALSVLWGWFMVPIFGFRELMLVEAIGLGMVVSYMTSQYISPKKDKDGKPDWGIFVYIFAKPALAVAMGAVVKQFL